MGGLSPFLIQLQINKELVEVDPGWQAEITEETMKQNARARPVGSVCRVRACARIKVASVIREPSSLAYKRMTPQASERIGCGKK